jgi:hypothetical protein
VRYQFTFEDDCLRAEIVGRETVAQTVEFIQALAAEAERTGAKRALIWVRRSRPIFRVEQYRISEHFKQIAARGGARVALLADSDELRASHEYIELLAKQNGAAVRAFRDEAAAREWLEAGQLQSQEKR